MQFQFVMDCLQNSIGLYQSYGCNFWPSMPQGWLGVWYNWSTFQLIGGLGFGIPVAGFVILKFIQIARALMGE